jgi:hypothetical protein
MLVKESERKRTGSWGIPQKKDLPLGKSGSWHDNVCNRLSYDSITCIRSKGRAVPFSALRLP